MAVQLFGTLCTAKIREFRSAVLQLLCTLRNQTYRETQELTERFWGV